MSLQRLVGKLAVLLAPCALVVAVSSGALAQAPAPGASPTPLPAPAAVAPAEAAPGPITTTCGAAGCGTGSCAGGACASGACESGVCLKCQKFHCPPAMVHCTPAPPKIKFKCTCPKPVCDPCEPDPTGNYGYTPTCWRPWMAPPNYCHCPVPTPTQFMPSSNAPVAALLAPAAEGPEGTLPPPAQLNSDRLQAPPLR